MSVPPYMPSGDPFQDMQRSLDTLMAIFQEIKEIQNQFARDLAENLKKFEQEKRHD